MTRKPRCLFAPKTAPGSGAVLGANKQFMVKVPNQLMHEPMIYCRFSGADRVVGKESVCLVCRSGLQFQSRDCAVPGLFPPDARSKPEVQNQVSLPACNQPNQGDLGQRLESGQWVSGLFVILF